jgi:hypothetical protein
MDATEKAKMLLGEINYDFRKFTMEDFIEGIEDCKERSILSLPFPMSGGIFGAWISDDEEPWEYIFYRNDVPQIHQVHIQLHEIAHFLCGHPTLRINEKVIQEFLRYKTNVALLESAIQRSGATSEQEIEAETLANMIQEKIIGFSRLDQLTQAPSSDEKISKYLESMGLA